MHIAGRQYMRRFGVLWEKIEPTWLAKVNGLSLCIMPDPQCGWLVVCTTAGHFGQLRPREGSRAKLNDAMFHAKEWADQQTTMRS